MPASLQLKLFELEVPTAVTRETGTGAFTSAGPVRWIGDRTETGAGAFTRAAPLSWIRDWTEAGAGAFTSAAPLSRTGDWEETGLACAIGTTTAAIAAACRVRIVSPSRSAGDVAVPDDM